jgi:hypothetical protein
MKMKLAKWVFSVLAASLLALTGTQANAQSRSSSGAEPPTVPDLVADAYRWGDFAELERLYAIYGKAGVRSELTGHPRLDHFWMGIGMINDSSLRVTDDYYEQLDALTKRWALDHPRSVLAQLLYASTLETRAWVYRGNGYAHTVSPAGWAGFRKYRAWPWLNCSARRPWPRTTVPGTRSLSASAVAWTGIRITTRSTSAC